VILPGFVFRALAEQLHRELCRRDVAHANPETAACRRAARTAAAVLEGDVEVAATAALVAAARKVDAAWNAYIDDEAPVDVPAEAIGDLRAALFELGEI